MPSLKIGLIAILTVLSPGAVWADNDKVFAPVPQTGQLISYDINNPQRDDGALQKGVELPSPRFIVSRGTVRDNLTGLIWLQDAGCLGQRSWQGAADAVKALNDGDITDNCGDISKGGNHRTDWRLPNIRELLSLVHYGFWQPALSNAAGTAQAQCLPNVDCPFLNFTIGPYWSSTSRFAGPDSFAWYVDFTEGYSNTPRKIELLWVLAVRGGN